MRAYRVGVLCDFVEERWPSMDFIADAIVDSLAEHGGRAVDAIKVRPPMTRRFSRRNRAGHIAYTVDRALNRFWDYPRLARRIRSAADVFHVVDHSYAQLVHELPASRTVVSCHDVDTFRCLTHPSEEPRSALFRLMATRILSGLQKAAHVCCDSQSTRTALIDCGAVTDDEKLSVIPLPVHPAFSPDPDREADLYAAKLLAGAAPTLDILHVGSTIRRKRIDVLLQVIAGLRDRVPSVRLVRAG